VSFVQYIYTKYKQIWIGIAILFGVIIALIGGWYANEHYPLLTFRVAVIAVLIIGILFSIKFLHREYKLFKKQGE